MTLRERLDADMKDAMRAKEKLRLDTIRMVKSAIKYKELEPGATGLLDEAGILGIVNSELKKRRDSIVEFQKGNRQDLVDQSEAEVKLLLVYLPAQLTADEITALVAAAVAESGAKGPKEMGAVMKLLSPKTTGRADGKLVADAVKAKLAALG